MGWRKIVVDDKIYRWRGASHVTIQDEKGMRVGGHPTAPDIKGITWDVWERGQLKKTSDGMITPGEIANYIRKVTANVVSG